MGEFTSSNLGSSHMRFYRTCPLLIYLDWLLRPWAYFDTASSGVNYLVAGCSFYGGILFVIGGFAGSLTSVENTAEVGAGAFGTLYAGSTVFTFFLGTYFFTLGCFMLSVEALNGDYSDEVRAWKAGLREDKPKFRWVWFEPDNLGWWAGVSYTFGAILYNIGATTTLVVQYPCCTSLSSNANKILAVWTFTIGGFFFFASGLFYVIIHTGNPLKGIFVPFNRSDLHDLDWWVNWNNFWGGVCFCMSGVWGWFYGKIPLVEYQVQNLIGFGVGAMFFVAAGLILYIKASLDRCLGSSADPSVTSQDPHAPLWKGDPAKFRGGIEYLDSLEANLVTEPEPPV